MASQTLLDQKISAVQPIIDRYINDESIDAVYLTGSLMARLGTPYSDIDIFVIGPSASWHHETGSHQHGRGLDRLDVEFRNPEWLDRVSALADPYTATVDDSHVLWTPSSLIDDAVRLSIGQVVKQSPGLTDARKRLAEGQDNFRKLLIAHISSDVADTWMDALGFLCHKDAESLEIISRTILQDALDAGCVADGDLYRGEKWVWSRVRRSETFSGVDSWLRELLVGPAAGQEHGRKGRYVERMLAAQKIMAISILRGWQSAGSSPTLMPATHFARYGFIRSPYWMITRMTDSAILIDRDTQYYCAPNLAVTCWAAADGLSRESLAATVKLLVPDARAQEIEATIDELEKIGAITREDAWDF
jgi:predicted nucleotidyltransferase